MNRKATRTPPVTTPVQERGSYPVVGIGASAGGIDAVKSLLGSLPEKSGMAFVVVMHFSPEHASHLDSILATATSMPVTLLKLQDIWSHAQHIQVPSADGLGPIEVESTAQGGAEEDRQALKDVMVMLQERTGNDFNQYKRATVLRRIERRLQVTDISTLPVYRDFMRAQRAETASLLGDLLIGVTAFFRVEEAFAVLEKELDRAILARRPTQQLVRVWVAGCATGEEAYSVAMLMAERSASANVKPEVQIFASDIDERAIAHGRAAMYSENVLVDLNANRRAQFVEQENGHCSTC